MDQDRVYIWRPDIDAAEREALRSQVDEALDFPPLRFSLPGISREFAHYLAAEPAMNFSTARSIARQVTEQDREILEAFQAQSGDDCLHPEKFPLIGVVIDGRLVSLAHSSRRTSEACELGIDTLPEARRKGYALAATIVWTRAILQEELVPLYSALAENNASLRLAERAGYRIFARVATFEKDNT
jgi:RimJ/RimL family protein N-acetyltransferase